MFGSCCAATCHATVAASCCYITALILASKQFQDHPKQAITHAINI